MTTSPARTVSISVDREPGAVYDYVCDPRNLAEWAPGFAKAVHRRGGGWVVETDAETFTFAFEPTNMLGVLDHRVTGPDGVDAVNPMRVIANGDGSEVLFTLFRREGISDEDFQRDRALVKADLRTLKRVLESGSS